MTGRSGPVVFRFEHRRDFKLGGACRGGVRRGHHGAPIIQQEHESCEQMAQQTLHTKEVTNLNRIKLHQHSTPPSGLQRSHQDRNPSTQAIQAFVKIQLVTTKRFTAVVVCSSRSGRSVHEVAPQENTHANACPPAPHLPSHRTCMAQTRTPVASCSQRAIVSSIGQCRTAAASPRREYLPRVSTACSRSSGPKTWKSGHTFGSTSAVHFTGKRQTQSGATQRNRRRVRVRVGASTTVPYIPESDAAGLAWSGKRRHLFREERLRLRTRRGGREARNKETQVVETT